MTKHIKIGSRASQLALAQANLVKNEILQFYPTLPIEIVAIKTKGDVVLNKTLDKIGGKGVFVKEIETALLQGEIDMAVHSLKDMPTQLPDGLRLGATPKRENPFDVFISGTDRHFSQMPYGAVIGTGSQRRACQLKSLRADIKVVPIRGNINTRLSYVNKTVDGIVLAAAGLIRLQLCEQIANTFTLEEIVPAACQGILAVEIRENDSFSAEICEKINDKNTYQCQSAERSFLKTMEADCHAPIGAYACINENQHMLLTAVTLEKHLIRQTITGESAHCIQLGDALAKKIKSESKENGGN